MEDKNKKHWLDEPEPDLPEIDDPRVVEVWEEPEDWGDGYPLPRYARVHVKFKPWLDDDCTEVLSYYNYLEEVEREKKEHEYTCPEIDAMKKATDEFFSFCDGMFKK